MKSTVDAAPSAWKDPSQQPQAEREHVSRLGRGVTASGQTHDSRLRGCANPVGSNERRSRAVVLALNGTQHERPAQRTTEEAPFSCCSFCNPFSGGHGPPGKHDAVMNVE